MIMDFIMFKRGPMSNLDFLMQVSPPDPEGFVNFGDIQIMSKLQMLVLSSPIACLFTQRHHPAARGVDATSTI
jgi:hypothetical protein